MTEKSVSYILSVNCGSSSLKFTLYETVALIPKLTGGVNGIGSSESKLEIRKDDEFIEHQGAKLKNLTAAVQAVIRWLKDNGFKDNIAAIGHRLVQGGPEHRAPELITASLLKSLAGYTYLAPNHLPDEIKTIKTFSSAFPGLPQVACFDTAFHKDMPDQAKYYPLPAEYRKQGLLHYGFHGLSYEFILQKLAGQDKAVLKQKVIIAHLGNGASMAAVYNGASVETTMGLSPIGGLVMGSRSGDLDPGVLLFLLKQGSLTPTQLDKLLSKQSGLMAVAGYSDMQQLLKREGTDAKAKEAIDLYCYQARKFIGSLAAAMGGIDLLVFTGGVGEHAAVIRERICAELEFLGLNIDQRKNDQQEENVSLTGCKVRIKVLKTDEEIMIARHTQHIIQSHHKTTS